MARRIRKADLATEKEILSFFTLLMRDEDAETTLRMRAAEMIYKQLHMTENTTSSKKEALCIQVEYQKGGEDLAKADAD